MIQALVLRQPQDVSESMTPIAVWPRRDTDFASAIFPFRRWAGSRDGNGRRKGRLKWTSPVGGHSCSMITELAETMCSGKEYAFTVARLDVGQAE